jgi:hypothetical protein
MYKVLSAENCSGGDTQQPAAAASQAAHSQPISPPPFHTKFPSILQSLNPPSKNLMSSFRESFLSSGKQGGGAGA